MKTSRLLRVSILGFGSLAILASGAAADWLVTQDGAEVEIRGTWKVEGQLVTFTLPNGTLGSMPLSAVDLEASERVTWKAAEAANPKPTAPPAPRPAEFVITDADVGHPSAASSADEGAASEAADAAPAKPSLRVSGWRENVDMASNSLVISGMLQNPTPDTATTLALDVRLIGDDGTVLETVRADLERGFLNPGASIRFEARFTETMSYNTVDFAIQSRGFLANPPEAAPGAETGDGEAGSDEAQNQG